MVGCCVPFCKSRRGVTAGVAFHRFPSDPDRKEKWIKSISRRGENPGTLWQPSAVSAVCSKHFEELCYNPHHTSKRILQWYAVPTIFPGYPPYKQRYSFDGNPVRRFLKKRLSVFEIEESKDENIQTICVKPQFNENSSDKTREVMEADTYQSESTSAGESDDENTENAERTMYKLQSTFKTKEESDSNTRCVKKIKVEQNTMHKEVQVSLPEIDSKYLVKCVEKLEEQNSKLLNEIGVLEARLNKVEDDVHV